MNNKIPTIKTVTLAYFSGTGGTEAIVNCFEKQFLKLGINVNMVDVSCSDTYPESKRSELLIIFSPVYAFRLASIMEGWVKNLPRTQKNLAAVISVSGGGEVSPNTACRLYCKHLLTKKGYHLIYEKMLVMPSNFASQAEHQINLMLINAMPRKVEQIISGILSGEINITKPKLLDRLFAFIGIAEHFGARIFGLSIHASEGCNKCGLCEKKCPTKNITIKNGTLRFGFKCIWCLKCIYSCPTNALSPRLMKFIVLKNGYNIKQMSEDAKFHCNKEYNISKSISWRGVINYLEKD